MDKKPVKEEPNVRPIIYSDTDFTVVQSDSVSNNAALLKNKIVMLGTLNEEADMHITPIGKMAGMKIQAYSVLSYLQHRKIVEMSTLTSIILTFLLCYFSAIIGDKIIKKFKVMFLYWLELYYFLIASLMVWIGFICFVRYNYNINLLYPLIGIALVEQARKHYIWIIKMITIHTKWKWVRHSIYYNPS